MKIDLHVHTIYSDGEKTPLEILEMCNKNNISTVAITDHGNILGAKKAIKENVNIPVKFVGLGEKAEDLLTFDIEKYIYGLFKDLGE